MYLVGSKTETALIVLPEVVITLSNSNIEINDYPIGVLRLERDFSRAEGWQNTKYSWPLHYNSVHLKLSYR